MKLTNILLTVTALITLGAASARADWAQDKYERLESPEQTLVRSSNHGPVVGAHVEQKDAPDGNFCRKITAVAPNAKPSFACYTMNMSGDDARGAFDNSSRAPFSVMFYIDNSPRLGSSWAEKFVTVQGEDELCVRTTAIAPRAKPGYACYTTRPPLGGGISVGN